jgi:hypothetical protein
MHDLRSALYRTGATCLVQQTADRQNSKLIGIVLTLEAIAGASAVESLRVSFYDVLPNRRFDAAEDSAEMSSQRDYR